jgi:hypothetical protein
MMNIREYYLSFRHLIQAGLARVGRLGGNQLVLGVFFERLNGVK